MAYNRNLPLLALPYPILAAAMLLSPAPAQAQTPCENPKFKLFTGGPFEITRYLTFRKRFIRGSSIYIEYEVLQLGGQWRVQQLAIEDPRLGDVVDPKSIYRGPEAGVQPAVDGLCGKGWYDNTLDTAPRENTIQANGGASQTPDRANTEKGAAAPKASGLTVSGHAAQQALAVDVNGDGVPDSVVLLPNGTLQVAVRDSTGKVTAKNSYVPGANPQMVAAGDFNGDGKTDLAVTLFGGSTSTSADKGSVAILLGNGDGTFQAPKLSAAGINPVAIGVGDFNRDGKLDIVAGNNPNTVSVALGNGDGSFQSPVTYVAGNFPASIVAADFNGDGFPDIATANTQDKTVAVLLGMGDGKFRPVVTTAILTAPVYLAYADFNHDGKLDLAAICKTSNSIAMLMGKGDGSFQPPAHYAVGAYPASVGVVSLNDGATLLFTGDNITGDTTATIAASDGTVSAPLLNFVGASPAAVAAADFNGDGIPDVVTVNQGSSDISVLLSQPGGRFKAAVSYPMPSGAATVGIADLNNDGKPDIVTGSGVFLGNGDGTFRAFTPFPGGVNGAGMVLADFNGDGKPDVVLVLQAGGVSVLLGNGDGSFKAPVTYASGNLPGVGITAADFNGDGRMDLAVTTSTAFSSSGTLAILLGNGDGTFKPPATSQIPGASLLRLAAGDLNGDRKQDLAVLVYTPANSLFAVASMLGNGDGTFQKPVLSGTDSGPTSISIADLDGDGRPDLVVGHCCGLAEATYLLGNGDGTFADDVFFPSGSSPVDIAVTDFDHDGWPDLVIALANGSNGGQNGSVTVLINDFPSMTTVSNASYQPLVAPASIASIFGSALATGSSGAGPANTLAGSSVTVRDSALATRSAPLFFASPGQINLEIPDGTATGTALVTVNTSKGKVTGTAQVADLAPALYTLNAAGLIAANVLRVSGTSQTAEQVYQVNNAGAVVARPIDLGPPSDQIYLVLYGTGLRGAAAGPASVTIGAVPVNVQYAGMQGAFLGLDQVNVLVPRSLAGAGDVPITLTVAGISSNVARVSFQ